MKRKTRIANQVDENIIKENVEKTKYDKEKKDQLLKFAIRFNDLLFEKNIHQEKFAEKVGIGVTSISKYRNGLSFPKFEFIEKIAKELNVSPEYLLGKSETKEYKNNQISKLFGLNDNAIDVLSVSFNKEYINTIFDNDIDSVNYFMEKLKNYVDAQNKQKIIKDDLESCWNKNEIDFNRYCLLQSFIDLIDENIKR